MRPATSRQCGPPCPTGEVNDETQVVPTTILLILILLILILLIFVLSCNNPGHLHKELISGVGCFCPLICSIAIFKTLDSAKHTRKVSEIDFWPLAEKGCAPLL